MPKKPARKPRKPIPAPLQRCVTSVAPKMKAQGRGVGAAFAICTSQLQKSGVLKPGTRTVTHKGAGVISGIARRGEYRSTMREFEKVVSRKNGAEWTEPPVVASTTYRVSPSERGTVGWSEVRVDMRVGRHVIDFDVFHDGRQSGFLEPYGELRRTLRYDDVAERHTDRIMAQVDRMIASYPGVVRRDIPGLSGYHGHYFPRKNGSSLTRKNPTASENGRYVYVMSCPNSTYEDIQALQASEKDVSRATFAKAIGKSQWADIQASLGYDRHFPIARDWHVGYYKGVFRGVPCYFLRHSRIEHIYTLNGDLGPSLEEE